MHCPFCDHLDTKVIDARNHRDAPVKWRRRECSECGRRFTTYERVEDLLPEVVKRDGRREAYSRAKLQGGLHKACEKRPISVDALDDVVARVERAVLEEGGREISSQRIGEEMRAALKTLDPVAWLRFSAVYLDYDTVDEFRSALDEYDVDDDAPAS